MYGAEQWVRVEEGYTLSVMTSFCSSESTSFVSWCCIRSSLKDVPVKNARINYSAEQGMEKGRVSLWSRASPPIASRPLASPLLSLANRGGVKSRCFSFASQSQVRSVVFAIFLSLWRMILSKSQIRDSLSGHSPLLSL